MQEDMLTISERRDLALRETEATDEWGDTMRSAILIDQSVNDHHNSMRVLIQELTEDLRFLKRAIPWDSRDDVIAFTPTDLQRVHKRILLQHEYYVALFPEKTDALNQLRNERLQLWEEVDDIAGGWKDDALCAATEDKDFEMLDNVLLTRSNNMNAWSIVETTVLIRCMVHEIQSLQDYVPQAILEIPLGELETDVIRERAMQ